MKITTLDQLTDAIERVADELQNVDLSAYVTKAEASDTFLTKTEYEEGGNLTDYLSKSEASSAYLAKTAWQPFGTSDLSSDGTEGYVPAPPATPTYKVLTNLGWKSLESDVPIVIDAVPIHQGALTYDGTAKTPKWLYYNPLELQIGGVYQNQINARTYNASFTPVGDVKWSNGTQDALNATWTINKAACPATLSNTTSNVNVGSTSTFTVNRPGDGVITATSNNPEIATVEVNGTNILGRVGKA